jgi:hypothetical protein
MLLYPVPHSQFLLFGIELLNTARIRIKNEKFEISI